MTVSLKANFFQNARGLTFEDSASVTWAINANSNQLTATATGAGGPVSANPSATIGLSAVNGTAATFMTSDSAPPLSQAIAPTWTGQHIFTPGSSTTAIIVNTTVNNVGLSVRSGSGSGAIVEVCGDGSGTGNGLSLTQTSVGAGVINLNFNAALSFKVNGTTRLTINADGGVVVGGATGGDQGAGTLNAQGLYVNGTAVLTTVPVADSVVLSGGNVQLSGDSASPGNSEYYGTNGSGTKGWYALPAGSSGANPSATIGLSAVNGSATTFMRSDGAPALGVTISPTWTGNHTFSPSAGVAGKFNAVSGSYALQIQGAGTSGNNLGLLIQAGAGSGDAALAVLNSAASLTFFEVFGDGHGTLGNSTTSGLQWSSAGVFNFSSSFVGNTATSALGYAAGAGGAVTQLTSRTTGVTLNKITGAITLVNAAGSATAATFTVSNTTVAATDNVVVSVKSGTNVYHAWVSAVAASSFNITFQTTGGTSTDSPVFNFAVIKSAAS